VVNARFHKIDIIKTSHTSLMFIVMLLGVYATVPL